MLTDRHRPVSGCRAGVFSGTKHTTPGIEPDMGSAVPIWPDLHIHVAHSPIAIIILEHDDIEPCASRIKEVSDGGRKGIGAINDVGNLNYSPGKPVRQTVLIFDLLEQGYLIAGRG